MILTETLSPAPGTTRTREPWPAAGAALAVVGWGANQFAPLVLLYRQHLGVSPSVAEAIFGLYAAGLIPALLVAGPLSDRIGRRPVVLTAVALSVLSGLVLMLGPHGLGWLYAGRVLMGVASGMAFSAGAAWLKELSASPYSTAGPGAGARRAGVAMTIGFGMGPLVAGLLAQWGPAPMVVPYIPQLVLGLLALGPVARTPETVARVGNDTGDDAGSAARRGLATHDTKIDALQAPGFRDRRFVRVVLPMAPWVFGSAVIAMVYLPGLTASHVAGSAIAFTATTAAVTALSGVFVQPVARRISTAAAASPGRPVLLVLGLGLVTVGSLAAAGVAALGSLGAAQAVLGLVVAAVMGCGYGILMVYGLTEVAALAPAAHLARMTSVFQAFTYAGFAAPYLLSSIDTAVAPDVALLGVAALAAVTLGVTARQASRV